MVGREERHDYFARKSFATSRVGFVADGGVSLRAGEALQGTGQQQFQL
jgi:hypothetical protein